MPKAVAPIPAGYHSVTPYLIVDDGAKALAWYQATLGATECLRVPTPTGKVSHAELQLGTSRIMLADEFPELGALSPKTIGGSPISLMVYLPDVDAVMARALANGATLVRPIEDKFYGDRAGSMQDPFGHHWYLATHVEDVEPEELQRRAEAAGAEA